MKRRWVHRSAQAATLLTVQTASLADRIAVSTGRARERIAVIPHGPGLVSHLPAARGLRRSSPMRVGYVAKWGVQKNFGTLFEAARLLRAGGANFKIVVTLDENAAQTRQVLDAARDLQVADLIDNAGELGANGIAGLYDSLDVFVLPSLCESFGLPLVEAMARGLPVVVASTRENLEVADGAALSFAPLDAAGLASHVDRLLHDDAERGRRAELSLARGRLFSWERAAERTIGALESLL
jgi:glycosyltransferase involved in cell wall biosynthesis